MKGPVSPRRGFGGTDLPSPTQVHGRGQPSRAAGRGGRVAWMDDLRLAVITGVIAVHIIGTYGVDVGWYEQGPNIPDPAIMVLAGPVWAALLFGLAPLFVLAGWSAAHSIDTYGVAVFVRRRLVRIGLPLALFVAVIDPLTAFVASGPQQGSWWALWRRVINWNGHDLGPAWFLFALLALSLIFALLGAARPQVCDRRERRDGGSTILVCSALVAAAVAVLDVIVWWRWSYGETSPWNLDPAHWPQAAGAFALGVLAFRGRWFEPLPRTTSRAGGLGALMGLSGLTVLGVIVLTTTVDYRALAGGGRWPSVAFAAADGVIAIGFSLWIAGFFQARRQAVPSRLAAATIRGSYAAYLLHPPVVVAMAVLLQLTDWPAGAQLAVLATVGVPISLLVGACAARVPVLNRVV
jgi:glucan biosynthesis protein C